MELGKYEIYEVIGKGGFGTVYRALDRALGIERAIKIMHPALSQDNGFLERFRLEAHIAAKLDHPHIVPVHDLDEINGMVFLVMKYLPGGSLKQRLTNQGALPFPTAVKLLVQMASALDYAHQQSLIHRDVKPANVLFETDDIIRLTDFGFAKAMTEHDGGSSLTLSGALIGTPPYMAPEIWRHDPYNPAVDQYSLACLFYECLTGQALFAGVSPAEIMTRHVLDGPEFTKSWPTGVPAGLTPILEKALARDPAERFISCVHFAEAAAAITLPHTQSISRPTAAVLPELPVAQSIPQTVPGTLPDQRTESLPANPPLLSEPQRVLQTSAGFSKPAASARRKKPGWRTAGWVLGGLGLLAVCGLGITWVIDSLISYQRINYPATNSTQTLSSVSESSNENPVRVGVEYEGEGGEPFQREIFLEYPDGSKEYLTENNNIDEDPSFSPDGKLVAFSRTTDTNNDGIVDFDDNSDIYIVETNGFEEINLTKTSFCSEQMFSWSPDGNRIAFWSDLSGGDVFILDIYTGDRVQLTYGSGWGAHPTWSPDGEYIVFYSSDLDGSYISIIRPDGSDLRKLTDYVGNGWGLAWTTDGRIRFPYRERIYTIRPDGTDFLPADGADLEYVNQSEYGWGE